MADARPKKPVGLAAWQRLNGGFMEWRPTGEIGQLLPVMIES